MLLLFVLTKMIRRDINLLTSPHYIAKVNLALSYIYTGIMARIFVMIALEFTSRPPPPFRNGNEYKARMRAVAH